MNDQFRNEHQKKKYLRRYRKNIECIDRLKLKLEAIENRLLNVGAAKVTGMPKGGTPVTNADLIADKLDVIERIERLTAKGRELKRSVCEEIDRLEDSRYCEVLEAHFIDGLSCEEIAEEMGYTERYVYTLYAEAIKRLTEIQQ